MTEFLIQSSWLIPFYGLLGALGTLPWSLGFVRRTGQRPAAYINLLMSVLATVHGAIAFRAMWGQDPRELLLPWLNAADLHLNITLQISSISLGAIELISSLSLTAQVFALGYMEKDWSLGRFYGLMGFFEAALCGLALSDTLWLSYSLLELLTLSTYLLVGFWYAQPLVVTAARDAFLTKRVGDVFLLMGVVALSAMGAGSTFSELEVWADSQPLPLLAATLLGLALLAGPIGKCAQFPLHLWLDEAMEGPSPASILRNTIVVSAGAYVLIRLQPVVTLSPIVSDVIVGIGATTAIGASLVAIAQIDIKRTLSHSTSAYLGLVFVAVGQSAVDVALLLLLSHAIAKALLATSAGSVIATTSDQNITEMGGLWSRMPATTTGFVVGSLSLVSLLPLGMFWTLRRWVDGFWDAPLWLLILVALVNALSAINLVRVFRLVFLGPAQAKTRRAPEVPWPMAVPMVALIVVNLLLPLMLQRWQLLITWASPLVGGNFASEWGEWVLLASGLLGLAVGSLLPLRSRGASRPMEQPLNPLQALFAYDFYIDRIYRATVVALVNAVSRVASWTDRYVVDGLANAIGFGTLFGGQSLKYSATGQSQAYVVTILVGLGALLAVTFGLRDLWTEVADTLQIFLAFSP